VVLFLTPGRVSGGNHSKLKHREAIWSEPIHERNDAPGHRPWPTCRKAGTNTTLTLNLETKDGQEILKFLAGQADILIETYPAGTMDAWGIGYESSKLNPR